MTETEKIQYPVRINRYLFLKDYCSRRKADKFIENKLIKINGRVAVLGDKVQKGDKVEVGKEVTETLKKYEYIAYYKPIGIVSHNPQEGEKGIEDIFKWKVPLSPLGRLDKASEGLMLLSNDGRIVDRLLNPKYAHEKEYTVKVDKKITGIFMKKMETGVKIEKYKTKSTKVTKVNPYTFRIILTEGKKHQIRRMCAALGYQVQNLKRIRIANIKLGLLKSKQHRVITDMELRVFLESLGM
ncbi:MAG TPA: rRNA pseudouridine synthase [Candidatus Yonathbacteria bacterium]|nr:rRNA pseudouridine synthase [Candidatus Yonathbacteria bacterium]